MTHGETKCRECDAVLYKPGQRICKFCSETLDGRESEAQDVEEEEDEDEKE